MRYLARPFRGKTSLYRTLTRVLGVPALVFLTLAPALAAPDLSLEPALTTVEIDDVFTLELRISGASNVYGWQVDVFFDPTVVNVLSTSEGTFLSNGGFTTFFINGTLDNGTGLVDDMVATRTGAAVPGADGDGVLAQLEFQAVGAGTSALTIENVTLSDPSSQPLDVGTLSDASVQVAGGSDQSSIPALSLPGVGVFLLLLVGMGMWKRR